MGREDIETGYKRVAKELAKNLSRVENLFMELQAMLHDVPCLRVHGVTILIGDAHGAVRDSYGLVEEGKEHRQLETQIRQAPKMEALDTLAAP